MRLEENKGYQYARWCVTDAGQKVPRYVKLQAEQWLAIAEGHEPDAYVDEKTMTNISKLLGLMVHPDLQCPMDEGLEDYAWFLIVAVLCTKLHSEQGNIRYYHTAVLEICRKNFKTFNSAVIFILLMLTDQQFSRFFSVAPDLKLSKELQLAIKKIIKVSPHLVTSFKLLRSEIRCLITESDYTPLAYSEDKMDGKLANAFLADEAGAMDSYPVEAMRSSQITLFNKLGIIISTQYPNDNNCMIDEIDISKKTLDGLLADKRRFALLYEPDDEFLSNDQWMTNDLVIYQSNPVAVVHDYIFENLVNMRDMAILYENKRENYLCKHNNIKYKGLGTEGYIDVTRVQACKIPENKSFWKGKRVYVGLDLSLSEDNVAVALVTMHNGKLYAKVWGFVPTDRVLLKSKRESVDYNRLIDSGVCIACGDEVVDYSTIEDFIMHLEQELGVEIVQIGYDRWNAVSTVQKLEAAGHECVEIKQHSSVLHMPTKYLKEQILSGNFAYEPNQMLEINFQNARCTEDTNLNKYVNKKKSNGKVDMVVALINAVYLQQQELLYGNTFTFQFI